MRASHSSTFTLGVILWIAVWLAVGATLASGALAQNQSSAIRGRVIDPSGAAVARANISVLNSAGKLLRTVKTDAQGEYDVQELAPGTYTIQANANGFAAFAARVDVTVGGPQTLDIPLDIEVEHQEVDVTEQPGTVSTSPSENASALILSGKDLDTLSDDPDELRSELEAMAGPAAGPNGAQIYIDGFTGGELPPKSAIREIRINQNPFAAENDTLGYGRIEIFTKPGTDQLHGEAFLNGNDSAFNSRNPLVAAEPPYYSEMAHGSVSGPITKKASFFVAAMNRNIQDLSIVNAFVLDPSLQKTPFSQSVASPSNRSMISPRIDYQISPNNTLTVRYQYSRNRQTNNGVGQFALASQAFNVADVESTLQVSDTQVLSARAVNETRFEYVRDRSTQTPLSFDPALQVLGAFTSGGNRLGNIFDHQDHYELQNYTSLSLSHHLVKFGGRLRAVRDANQASTGYNGTFVFPSLNVYQLTQQNLQLGLTPAQTGVGPSQFSITAGNPLAKVSVFDAGLYVQDDWRLRPSMTLSGGLRFETQNDIHDHADVAPRLSFAWALDGKKNARPKTVLRSGFGIFYNRFGQDLVLQAERLNGINQQQFIVAFPTFYPNIPSIADLQADKNVATPTRYQIAPNLRAPYNIQAAAGLERQITKTATVSFTYLHTRGLHQLVTRNINAPLPGTFNPAVLASGVRPFGDVGNIYQYDSAGLFNENQLITNLNVRMGKKLSLFGYYSFSRAFSNTDGASTFPMDQYNLALDYGRASFDIAHRVFLGGMVALPRGFSLFPFMLVNSGRPFDITLGQDLNGDSIFNDRPGLVSATTCPDVVNDSATVECTPFGTFDSSPVPGIPLAPRNYGTGPAEFAMNLRISKTFGFGGKRKDGGDTEHMHGGGGRFHGPGPGGGLGPRGLSGPGGGPRPGDESATGQRYSMTFSVFARNLFNNVNLAPPVGVLNSPLFGRSNALAGLAFGSASANRSINLQLRFNF